MSSILEVWVGGYDMAVVAPPGYHGELSGIPEVLGPLLRLGLGGRINNA